MTTIASLNGRAVERFSSVESRTGKSRRQIYRDIAAGIFPQPVEIGPNSVAFFTDEIDAWLNSRPRVSYAAEVVAA